MKHFLSICILAACFLLSVQRCYAQVSWTSRTSAADNGWRSVTYGTVAGNGLFVAVANTGTGNRVMTSTDGITWTSRTSAADNGWISVTYGKVAGNGLFVAVSFDGTGNRVMTSPDGITWTSRTSAADNQWFSVTYGAGLFVAVSFDGTGNRVMTSPDGITWTSRTSADNGWYSVTYGTVAGNGLFVAVAYTGTGNRVMTSPDGITWTSRTSAADNTWISVTYGAGLFVAVAFTGTGNRVMTSPDGITWTSRTSAADNNWFSVNYAAGLFVAVAATGTGNRVMTSTDGITWTIRTSATDNNWRSVTYGNGLFVAVASTGTGNGVMTSAAEALPVNLLYFRGKASQSAEGYASELTWATDSEVNAKSYTIERSRDLQTFTTLNNQPAAGNSTEQKEYAYTDSKPFFGTNYYRLSQTDFDGSVHRYQPVAVIIEDRDMPFGVFPNPVSGNRFKVKVENADEAQLSLVNELGQKISIETSKLSETIVEVQAKTELPTGSFVVKVKGLVGERSYKLVVKN
jgi:hypothetical protein